MLFMGIFFNVNCCGCKVLVVLLLPLLLLLDVATACTASFHTLTHVKSLLTSADKLLRVCRPAPTEHKQVLSCAFSLECYETFWTPSNIPRLTSRHLQSKATKEHVIDFQRHRARDTYFQQQQRVCAEAGWIQKQTRCQDGAVIYFSLCLYFREITVGVLFFLAKILWKAYPVKSVSLPVRR